MGTPQLHPDFGIDRVIEVFERQDVGDSKAVAQTLGELLFVQIKSTATVKKSTRTVHSRMNVAKFGPEAPPPDDGTASINVIPYSIDVSLLNTVSAMGTAIPVLLFYVSLTENRFASSA